MRFAMVFGLRVGTICELGKPLIDPVPTMPFWTDFLEAVWV